jgi:hypothetical protein
MNKLKGNLLFIVAFVSVIGIGASAFIVFIHYKEYFIIGDSYYWHGTEIATMPEDCGSAQFDVNIGAVIFSGCGHDHSKSIYMMKGKVVSKQDIDTQKILSEEKELQRPMVKGTTSSSITIEDNQSVPILITSVGYVYKGFATFNYKTKLILIDLNGRTNQNGTEPFYGIATELNSNQKTLGIKPDTFDKSIVKLNSNHAVVIFNPLAYQTSIKKAKHVL